MADDGSQSVSPAPRLRAKLVRAILALLAITGALFFCGLTLGFLLPIYFLLTAGILAILVLSGVLAFTLCGRWRLIFIAATLLIGIAVAAAFLLLAASNKNGPTNKCSVEGPASPQISVSQQTDLVEGRLTLLPLGRACQWQTTSGTITTYSGDWTTTTTVGILLLVGATGIAVALRRSPRPDAGSARSS